MYIHFFKRIIDLLFALIALPFVLFIVIIVAPFIWFDDHGPIFYAGKRIGLRGKPFGMLKFRSMKVNAPDIRLEDGSTYNGDDDPRVTKVGRFLRKTSLDEIPQFINVLTTGYNQAYFRNSVEGLVKLKNDVYYAEHISFWLDVKIFFKTIKTVLFRENINIDENRK